MTARAITYYLDVSNECTRRITQVDGAIKAICNRLIIAQMNDRTSKDLGMICIILFDKSVFTAEQCVKLLEHICQREASAVYDAGGLQAMLHLIRFPYGRVFKYFIFLAITTICTKTQCIRQWRSLQSFAQKWNQMIRTCRNAAKVWANF